MNSSVFRFNPSSHFVCNSSIDLTLVSVTSTLISNDSSVKVDNSFLTVSILSLKPSVLRFKQSSNFDCSWSIESMLVSGISTLISKGLSVKIVNSSFTSLILLLKSSVFKFSSPSNFDCNPSIESILDSGISTLISKGSVVNVSNWFLISPILVLNSSVFRFKPSSRFIFNPLIDSTVFSICLVSTLISHDWSVILFTSVDIF